MKKTLYHVDARQVPGTGLGDLVGAAAEFRPGGGIVRYRFPGQLHKGGLQILDALAQRGGRRTDGDSAQTSAQRVKVQVQAGGLCCIHHGQGDHGGNAHLQQLLDENF